MSTKTFALPALFLLVLGATLALVTAQAASYESETEPYGAYRNAQYGYALFAPADLIVSEHAAPDGGETVLFTDPAGEKEFEIHAVPYSQLDLATGASELTPPGTTDQSDHLELVNVIRGDLFKVWFTKDGILYVVTTLPELEPWLTDILTNWTFAD